MKVAGLFLAVFAVLFGFWLEGGQLKVLFQPIEWFIILGLAYGSFVFGNPAKVVIEFFKRTVVIFRSNYYKKEIYRESLILVSGLANARKRVGDVQFEKILDDPNHSIYELSLNLEKEKRILNFIKDSFQSVLLLQKSSPDSIHINIQSEISIYYKFEVQVAQSVNELGESMPAFGIVAAIMGVVLAMANIGGIPEQIGHYISVALVGTLTGVALGYGLIKPMGNSLENFAYEQRHLMQLIERGIQLHLNDVPGQAIVETLANSFPSQAKVSQDEVIDMIYSIPKIKPDDEIQK